MWQRGPSTARIVSRSAGCEQGRKYVRNLCTFQSYCDLKTALKIEPIRKEKKTCKEQMLSDTGRNPAARALVVAVHSSGIRPLRPVSQHTRLHPAWRAGLQKHTHCGGASLHARATGAWTHRFGPQYSIPHSSQQNPFQVALPSRACY